jgi:tetratricopeptide (TPR) repeat protein
MERNSGDYGLKAQFIKFCLLNRFTNTKTIENYIAEALALFETIENDHGFDIQCHYLVGKYYQEDKNYRKAYHIYLNAIKRFNQYVAKHPNLKTENSELAYSISLNLMILQSNPIDPEVEKCFKIIHKSFPLHVKRFEFENEMAKPAPNKERIKQLKEEIRQLKIDEEKEGLTATVEEGAGNPVEYDQLKKEMDSNPEDYSLKVKLIKFCMGNRFTNPQVTKSHMAEVLALFDTIENAHGFDIECHYLVGKYYHEEKNKNKACHIYLNAIKRFNQYAVLSPDVESENSDWAYSIASNFLNLQPDPVDPEVEKCFKIIHKPYPLDVKRAALKMDLEEEAEPSPIVMQSNELPQSKAEEKKGAAVPANKKSPDNPAEYDQLKKDMADKPGDYGLKTQFVEFCLLNRSNDKITQNHIAEALKLFESIENGPGFDIECNSLVAKYYQEEKNGRKAYEVYLNAIKRFNRQAAASSNSEWKNSETAYSIALNLIVLKPTPPEPELEKYFKLIDKSYPLYVKRFEFEKEMAKPDADQEKIKKLKDEIGQLKAEQEKRDLESAKTAEVPLKAGEEKEAQATQKEKTGDALGFKPKDKNDIFSKLLKVPSLFSEPSAMVKENTKKTEKADESKDFFFLSPVSEASEGVTFMVFQNHNWDGPYTVAQLRSKKNLDKNSWVCRVGSQLVVQAYEVSDLQPLIEP